MASIQVSYQDDGILFTRGFEDDPFSDNDSLLAMSHGLWYAHKVSENPNLSYGDFACVGPVTYTVWDSYSGSALMAKAVKVVTDQNPSQLLLQFAQNGGGAISTYRASGLEPATKRWIGTALTNGSGAWSADISSAGFSSILNVNVSAILNDNLVTNQAQATLLTVSNTTLTGSAFRGTVLGVLGATLRIVPTSTLIYIEVIGL